MACSVKGRICAESVYRLGEGNTMDTMVQKKLLEKPQQATQRYANLGNGVGSCGNHLGETAELVRVQLGPGKANAKRACEKVCEWIGVGTCGL